jgi:Concanavalin A-like lectin/glucanases superfamily
MRLPPGWKHLAAVRQGGKISLLVEGKRVALSSSTGSPLDLITQQPLRVGLGTHDHFLGRLSDLRLYDRALSGDEIGILARRDEQGSWP